MGRTKNAVEKNAYTCLKWSSLGRNGVSLFVSMKRLFI